MSETVAPIFRSPVVAPATADPDAALTLGDLTATAKIIVRSEDEALLDARFGASYRDGRGTLVLGTRPGEWTLIGELADAAEIMASVPSGGHTSVIDWSHCRALFRLTGEDAARCLEKICGIDLDDEMTPDGAVFSASIAKMSGDLARDDADGVRSYLVLCDRSLGQYLYDSIIDAGNEFSIGAS